MTVEQSDATIALPLASLSLASSPLCPKAALQGFEIKSKRLYLKQSKNAYEHHPSTLRALDLVWFHAWLDEHPGVDPSLLFDNKRFRSLVAKLVHESESPLGVVALHVLDTIYPAFLQESAPELCSSFKFDRCAWLSFLCKLIPALADYTNYGLDKSAAEVQAIDAESCATRPVERPAMPFHVWEARCQGPGESELIADDKTEEYQLFGSRSFQAYLLDRCRFRQLAMQELADHVLCLSPEQMAHVFGIGSKRRKQHAAAAAMSLSPAASAMATLSAAALAHTGPMPAAVGAVPSGDIAPELDGSGTQKSGIAIEASADAFPSSSEGSSQYEALKNSDNRADAALETPSRRRKDKGLALKSPLPTLDNGTAAKGKLSSFFTILKKDKSQSTASGFEDFFKPFFIKPGVQLACLEPKARGIASKRALRLDEPTPLLEPRSLFANYVRCLTASRENGTRRISWAATCSELRKKLLEHAQRLEQLRSGGSFDGYPKHLSARKRLCIDEDDMHQDESDDLQLPLVRLKLFQFHDNYRPAYCGTWSKHSLSIRPRAPFGRDASLNYSVDSDDEWEEDCCEGDMVESLSSGEDDDEEEEEDGDEDGDGSEDDWLVPHGYLSEDEGVEKDDAAGFLGSEDPLALPPEKYLQKTLVKGISSTQTKERAAKKALPKSLTPKVIGPIWHAELERAAIFDTERLRSHSATFCIPESFLEALFPLSEQPAQRRCVDPFNMIYGYPPVNVKTSQNLLESSQPLAPALLWKPALAASTIALAQQGNALNVATKAKRAARASAPAPVPTQLQARAQTLLAEESALPSFSHLHSIATGQLFPFLQSVEPAALPVSFSTDNANRSKQNGHGAVTDLTGIIRRTTRPLSAQGQGQSMAPLKFIPYRPPLLPSLSPSRQHTAGLKNSASDLRR